MKPPFSFCSFCLQAKSAGPLDNTGKVEFTYMVTGGSGRFEGATGTIVLQGYLYHDSWSLSGQGVMQFWELSSF